VTLFFDVNILRYQSYAFAQHAAMRHTLITAPIHLFGTGRQLPAVPIWGGSFLRKNGAIIP